MPPLLEKDIQRNIIDYLRLLKYVVFKHNSTQFGIRDGERFSFRNGDKGIADLIACSPKGRFVAIEVKKPGGKPSPDQLAFLDNVRSCGGIGILAFSLDDVVEALGTSH